MAKIKAAATSALANVKRRRELEDVENIYTKQYNRQLQEYLEENSENRGNRSLRKKKKFIDVPLVNEASAYAPPSKYFKKNTRRANSSENNFSKTGKQNIGNNNKNQNQTNQKMKGKDSIKKMVKNNGKNNRVLATLNESLLAPLKPVDRVTPRRLMLGGNKNKISKDLGLLAPYKTAVSAKKLEKSLRRKLGLLIRKTRRSLKSARELEGEKKKKDEKKEGKKDKKDDKKDDKKEDKKDDKKDGDKKDDDKKDEVVLLLGQSLAFKQYAYFAIYIAINSAINFMINQYYKLHYTDINETIHGFVDRKICIPFKD